MRACTVASLPAKVYQLGTGRGISFGDAALAVQRKFPANKLEVSGGLNFARGEKDPNYFVLDIEDARRDLGFEPQYDLNAGLDDFAATMDRLIANGVAPQRRATEL